MILLSSRLKPSSLPSLCQGFGPLIARRSLGDAGLMTNMTSGWLPGRRDRGQKLRCFLVFMQEQAARPNLQSRPTPCSAGSSVLPGGRDLSGTEGCRGQAEEAGCQEPGSSNSAASNGWDRNDGNLKKQRGRYGGKSIFQAWKFIWMMVDGDRWW